MSFSGHAVARKFPPFLGTATSEQREKDRFSALDTLGNVCRFRRGETIFGEGDELKCSYKILSGAVRLSRITQSGRRQIVGFRTPGEFVGFEWDGCCTLGVEAVRDVVAERYMRACVDRLIEECSDVRESLVTVIRSELRTAHEHLITLGCPSAKERVANFVLQLARKAGARDGETIEIELSRQDIADYLGLTLETISRTFSEFKSTGAIALPKRRQIRILDKARLAAKAT